MDLGLGRPATLSLELTYPRARDMAVIRGAAPPYSEGLFLHVSLARTDAARLRGHPVLAALVPGAAWVGAR